MMVGSCGQGPESCVQKQGKLMVLAVVPHFEYPARLHNELEVWLGSRLLRQGRCNW